jgi:hypothetical protein
LKVYWYWPFTSAPVRVLVEVLRVQALIALRRGQWDQPACSLEEGLARARAMPWPHAEARLLHLGGLRHVQHGEPEAARARLAAAQAIFARLGAWRDGATASLPARGQAGGH